MATSLLPPGVILSNTYKILNVLDQGGMGAIYKAESRLLEGEFYAVKEMLDSFSTPQDRLDGLKLFEQEGKILRKLRHPNLPRVHAFFEENNRNYLVMDFIKGRTLENIVESTSDFLPETVVLRWSSALCSILEYLHNQIPPIIFRDLNPRNIMLEDGTGEIKLIDFGIARVFKAGQSADTLSLGSPGYCPIEQYGRGQTDVRSDVYTLGATLYHLLTKKIPVAAIERIKPTPVLLTPPRKINRRISPKMDQVILRALEINPDQRFQTVTDFRQALFAQETTKIAAQPTQPTTVPTGQTTVPTQPKTTPASPKAVPKTAPPPVAQLPPKKSRFGKRAWIVILVLASWFLTKQVGDWQQRASGKDKNPGGAKDLAIPGVANDRVSFSEGDRIDWWTLTLTQPETLTVTVIPGSSTDGLKLTLFDQSGKVTLQEAVTTASGLEAKLVVDRPRTVLAQVKALKLWDSASYRIQTALSDTTGVLYASFSGDDSLYGGTHSDPESAPELRLNTITQGQLQVANGQGATWLRLFSPDTGMLTLTATTKERGASLSVDCYDQTRALLPVAKRRLDGLTLPIRKGEMYLVKVSAQNQTRPVLYELTATVYADPGVFSGADGSPFGARFLTMGASLDDTVSFSQGDQIDWWKLVFPFSGRIGVELKTRRREPVTLQLYDAPSIRANPEPDTDRARDVVTKSGRMDVDGAAGEIFYLAVVADEGANLTPYTLSAERATGPDDNSGPDGSPSGARALPINGSVRGEVDYANGDRTDWWRVTPTGPGVLTVTLIGRETTSNIHMALYDQTGEDRQATGQSSDTGREELTVDLAGKDPYLVKVFADGEDAAGDYQLLTWYSPGRASSGRSTNTSDVMDLSFDRPAKGRIDADGDRVNWWKVKVPGKGALAVELDGDSFSTNLDLAVYASDDRETPLVTSRNRNSSRERVSLDIDRAGWYYVEVVAQKSGDKNRYTLTTSFER